MKMFVVLVVGVLTVICQTCLLAQTSDGVLGGSIPREAVGQTCEIVLKSKTSTSTETDAGTVVRFDEKSIVLRDATRIVRMELRVPVLASVPYLGRLFRNVGIGMEKVTGELKVDREEIERIKFSR